MTAVPGRRRNHWGGISEDESQPMEDELVDQNNHDNIDDYQYQQYLNGSDNGSILSSNKASSQFGSDSLAGGSQSYISYITPMSTFGTSSSHSKSLIPLPPAPHIPQTSQKISQTTSVSSNPSSKSSTLGDYFESQQISSTTVKSESPQKHHLPWHNKIVQNNSPKRTNKDDENDTEHIYRRSIEDIASYYNDKDDSTIISRLSSIMDSTKTKTAPQNRSRINSIYNTASSIQPISHTLNENDEDDGTWYDPDAMGRMSNVPLDNESVISISFGSKSRALGTTMNERAQQYISEISNNRSDALSRQTRIIPKILCLVLAVTFVITFTFFTYSELVPLNRHNGSSLEGSKLPIAPSDLIYICDANQNGFPSERWEVEECETLCLAASCCVAPDHKLNYCFEDNIDACLSYQPCAVIQPVFGMLTQEAADVVSAGVKSENRTDDTGVSSPNESSSNHEINIMSEVCKPESYGTQKGKAQCEEYCVPSECCFSESGCWKSEDLLKSVGFYGSRLCSLYSSCLIVYFNEDQEGHGSFVADSESLDIIMRTVEERCDITKFKTEADIEVCQDLCLPSQCCFTSEKDDTSNYDCLESHVSLCAAYSFCSVLHDGTDLAEVLTKYAYDEDVTKVMEEEGHSYQQIVDDYIYHDYDQSLSPTLASIEQSSSPLKQQSDDNGIYKELDSVNDTAPSNNNNVTTVQSLKNSVDLACSPNTTFDEHNHILINNNATTVQCEDLCHPAQCCYHPDIESNCWDDLSVMCDTFASCGILGDDLLHTPPTVSHGDTLTESYNGTSKMESGLDLRPDLLSTVDSMLQMLCGDEEQLQMEDSLQQLCEEMCLPYSCCFVNGSSAGGGSDYSECEDFNTASLCPSYIACSVVYWSANNSVLGGVFLGSVTVKSSNDGNQ
mmetsp:Transcript_16281/g.18750  ORF Transcript_16281/g.18750 Transcript_16281/m.18750 type:complete len:901 (+) Transcript_16281:89-2791(+)